MITQQEKNKLREQEISQDLQSEAIEKGRLNEEDSFELKCILKRHGKDWVIKELLN